MGSNGFKLKLAEFRGQVLESLGTIKDDIKEIKVDFKADRENSSNRRKEIYIRLRKLESNPSFSTNPFQWIRSILGLLK